MSKFAQGRMKREKDCWGAVEIRGVRGGVPCSLRRPLCGNEEKRISHWPRKCERI